MTDVLTKPVAAAKTASAQPILAVNNIEVIYDHVILVLKGVSLAVPKGGIVAILGANGAGKSTTLKSISNLVRAERGDVTKGRSSSRASASTGSPPTTWSARLHPGDGGPPLLRPPDGRGEPADRRLHAPRRTRLRSRPISRWSTPISRGSRSGAEPGRLHLRRRAADDGDRPGADVAADDDPARRAVDGAGAADRRADLRDRAATSTPRRR